MKTAMDYIYDAMNNRHVFAGQLKDIVAVRNKDGYVVTLIPKEDTFKKTEDESR